MSDFVKHLNAGLPPIEPVGPSTPGVPEGLSRPSALIGPATDLEVYAWMLDRAEVDYVLVRHGATTTVVVGEFVPEFVTSMRRTEHVFDAAGALVSTRAAE